MTKKPKPFNPDDLVKQQVDEIDEQLAVLDRRMAKFNKYNEAKQKLLAARRALLGGNRMTGAGGNRLTLDDVVGFLKDKPGASPGQIAERFGVSQSTVSSHIYRNKDKFINRGGRYWVRDPKNGLDTADDIEDDD